MNNLVVIIVLAGSLSYLFWGLGLQLSLKTHWQLAGFVTVCSLITHGLIVSKVGYGHTYVAYMCLCSLLLLLGVSDAMTYQLPTDLLVFGLIAGLVLILLEGDSTWWMNIVVAAGVFLFIYLLGKLLRGGIGEGDAYVVAMLALYLGGMHMLVVVLVGLLFSALIGIGMMIFGGKSRKTVLPFVPFMAVAHISLLLFW